MSKRKEIKRNLKNRTEVRFTLNKNKKNNKERKGHYKN